jgi:spore coat polysaccharide biosynthesis protein SpsF
MTSTRLPGKVMREVLGQPLLYYHLSRLKRARLVDSLVVATTVNASDDVIASYCDKMKIPVFRGAEHDVLSRYEGAVEKFGAGAEIVVRVTSDCPLIDPEIVDATIQAYLSGQPDVDYVAVDNSRFPRGLDVEVFRRKALSAAAAEATEAAEREHVTPFIYRRKGRFSCATYTTPENHGGNRWCVDEPADFELIRRILEGLAPLKPDFGWRDCLQLLRENPDWSRLNAEVEQKHLAPSP